MNWRFLVTDAKQGSKLYGEYALKVNLATNEVTYNTYYMPNAEQKVEELQNQFYALNAEYAKKSLVQEFKKKGFTYKSNDRFAPTTEEVYSFFMVGRSKDKNEDEPVAQIKFIILKDGTIVTDSDYLPNDVNAELMEFINGHVNRVSRWDGSKTFLYSTEILDIATKYKIK